MSLHKDDWLKILGTLGAAAATVYSGGAAAPWLAGMFGVGEGAGAAGATGAGVAGTLGSETVGGIGGLSASGMFAQTPGVTAGSQQALMLAAQNEGLGGAAADLTAKAAMGPVNAAQASGQMGIPQWMGEKAKLDMAGMNDPRVWMSRAGSNLDRMAGGASKMAALQALTGGGQQQPASMPMQRAQQQAPQGDIQSLIAAAKRGDPQAAEALRRMGIDPTRI